MESRGRRTGETPFFFVRPMLGSGLRRPAVLLALALLAVPRPALAQSFSNTPVAAGDMYGPKSTAVGDFNGDGKLDLAVVNSGNNPSLNGLSNSVTILLGDGAGVVLRRVRVRRGVRGCGDRGFRRVRVRGTSRPAPARR